MIHDRQSGIRNSNRRLIDIRRSALSNVSKTQNLFCIRFYCGRGKMENFIKEARCAL